jgi:hypothetical protein
MLAGRTEALTGDAKTREDSVFETPVGAIVPSKGAGEGTAGALKLQVYEVDAAAAATGVAFNLLQKVALGSAELSFDAVDKGGDVTLNLVTNAGKKAKGSLTSKTSKISLSIQSAALAFVDAPRGNTPPTKAAVAAAAAKAKKK